MRILENGKYDVWKYKMNRACVRTLNFTSRFSHFYLAFYSVVTPELRAVVVNVNKEEKLLYVHFYYDNEVSEEIIELWNCAITEASADLEPDCLVDEKIERRLPKRNSISRKFRLP